jgi:hypothetical protein
LRSALDIEKLGSYHAFRCLSELDIPGRPTRRQGRCNGVWMTALSAIRGLLKPHMRLPDRSEPELKRLGNSGFKSRRTHYCIVRADLPRGVLAAQLVHAAGESSPGNLPSTTFAVVLAADDEAQLERIERELCSRGIDHRAVREPDSPWEGALMAIGIQPVSDRSTLKPVTGGLPLLR